MNLWVPVNSSSIITSIQRIHVQRINLKYILICFPGGSVVMNPPAVQEMKVQFLSLEDPLEKEMATHFSILAWKIPWTEEPGGLQSMESQRVGHNLVTKQQ